MYTDRPLLKSNAKAIMRTARPSLITAGLIFLAAHLIFSLLLDRVMGVNITTADAQRYLTYYTAGDFESAFRLLEQMSPPQSAYLVTTLLKIAESVISFGFTIFVLNTVKNAGAAYGNLLDGFSQFFRLLWLEILTGVIVTLWSLLLVIPGIIAAYRYRLAPMILAEHPEYSALECLKESHRLMQGHKWELFVLDLSFLGWLILASLPYVGFVVMIWTIPYMRTTYVLYYMAVKNTPVIVNTAPSDGSGTPFI